MLLSATAGRADTRDAELLKQGTDAFEKGQYEIAIARFSDAIRLAPEDAKAWGGRGQAYALSGNYDRAIADYNQALLFDPSNSHTYILLGNAWFEEGNYRYAWNDYNQAIQIDPRNAYAYVCRGFAAAERGAYDQAIADYDQAIRLDPAYKDAYRYRERAIEKRNDLRMRKILRGLFILGGLALLLVAFRAYRLPTAFSHFVDGYFKRTPDGNVIFNRGSKNGSYTVPDAETEQALRSFARRRAAAVFAFGAFLLVFSFVLGSLTWPLVPWLQTRTGISTIAVIVLINEVPMVVILVAACAALTLWNGVVFRGLSKAKIQEKPPPAPRRLNDLVLDMPVSVRLVVSVMLVLMYLDAFQGLPPILSKWSLADIAKMSSLDWYFVATNLLMLWFLGWSFFQLWRPPRMT